MSTLEVFMNGKYSSGFDVRARWELAFVWWPSRCDITNKRLWLCMAYRGTAMWTGPGDPVYETRWHEKNEHLIWELKGKK